MKCLQIAFFATILIASTYALSCNVGSATGTCPATDLGAAADTCFKCVTKGVAVSSGCMAASSCATIKTACNANGVYSDCTTANCNGCSPASALQASAVLLVGALAAMLF